MNLKKNNVTVTFSSGNWRYMSDGSFHNVANTDSHGWWEVKNNAVWYRDSQRQDWVLDHESVQDDYQEYVEREVARMIVT